ncbi:hypothetical protein L917_18725 [Phytophthora nicotianae]|uniref:RxLR effector protein n=1 Tax=Phytophthora nicotianae TaxID=4792 RepID=W2K8D6_PHYNI|nr:hypothetical protein L917_18725 [Phytophthora nicotianae]
MWVYHLLLVLLVVACSSFANISAAQDLNPSVYSPNSALSNAGGSNRVLRTRAKDSEEGEERVSPVAALEGWNSKMLAMSFEEANALFNTGKIHLPQGVTAEQARDWLWSKNIDLFIGLENKGKTLKSMREELKIDEKIRTMSPKALKADPDYMLYTAFETYWGFTRKNQASVFKFQ